MIEGEKKQLDLKEKDEKNILRKNEKKTTKYPVIQKKFLLKEV